jgi:hypothetical protein
MINFSEDYGSIVDIPTEIIDGGNIPTRKSNSSLEESCEEDEENKFSPNCFSYCSNGTINSFKIKGSSQYTFKKLFVAIKNLNENSIVFFGIILTWIGFGTLFEIDNGLERIVSPYKSSGTIR